MEYDTFRSSPYVTINALYGEMPEHIQFVGGVMVRNKTERELIDIAVRYLMRVLGRGAVLELTNGVQVMVISEMYGNNEFWLRILTLGRFREYVKVKKNKYATVVLSQNGRYRAEQVRDWLIEIGLEVLSGETNQ